MKAAIGYAATVVRSMWRHAGGRFPLAVLGLWAAVWVASVFWTPQPLMRPDGYHTWQSPSAEHWLGTDGTGADVFSWLMAGSRTDLLIVILTVLVAAALGLLFVAAMVSRHTALAGVSVVVVDALISIPTVLIALVLAAQSDYAVSAVSNGASGAYVFFRHIVPNILPVMLVQLSLSAGTAVLAESGLTYLGVGVPSGTPSWGHTLATTVRFITVYPLTVLWPGLVVTVAVVALNLFGDALRDAIDPVTNPELRRAAGVTRMEEDGHGR